MDTSEEPEFSSMEDEVAYWKQMASEYSEKLRDTRDEFDEFQDGSRELEAELEAQLEQYEVRVKDLLSIKSRLEQDNDSLKEKLEESQKKAFLQIASLQDENAEVVAVRDSMQKYIRELEQTNDDLERSKRATLCSLEDFEHRLNTAIERNAFLENELDEKEELMVTVQRLKDETRDLRAEIAVKPESLRHKRDHEKFETAKEARESAASEDKTDHEPPTLPIKIDNPLSDSNKNKFIHTGTSPANSYFPNSALTPSARISALNIVGDLLRKVGALESKLASCRNFVQDTPRQSRHNTLGSIDSNGVADSPRAKKQNTGRNGQPPVQGLVKVVV